jgi:hypothetical protein
VRAWIPAPASASCSTNALPTGMTMPEVPRGLDTLIPGFSLGKDVPVSGSSKYPEQFRQDAVALARSTSRPLAGVARELGVNHETLCTWVRSADHASAPGDWCRG